VLSGAILQVIVSVLVLYTFWQCEPVCNSLKIIVEQIGFIVQIIR